MNNNTRRHPRTMEEAFGPYARSSLFDISEPAKPMDKEDRIVLTGCLVAGAVLLAFVLIGVI